MFYRDSKFSALHNTSFQNTICFLPCISRDWTRRSNQSFTQTAVRVVIVFFFKFTTALFGIVIFGVMTPQDQREKTVTLWDLINRVCGQSSKGPRSVCLVGKAIYIIINLMLKYVFQDTVMTLTLIRTKRMINKTKTPAMALTIIIHKSTGFFSSIFVDSNVVITCKLK